MRFLLLVFLPFCPGFVFAEANLSFSVAGRTYQLNAAQATIQRKDGKIKLLVAAKDKAAQAMIAITAEIPENAMEKEGSFSTLYTPLSLTVVSNRGVYTVLPAVSLARDSFMRYTKREETETGELEDDPNDRPHQRFEECRRFSGSGCERILKEKPRRIKKVRVSYTQHGPTWVNKTREERIASGDGIMRENKYRDTGLYLYLKPENANGRVTHLSGSFSGNVLYNEGMNAAVRVRLDGGQFSVAVTE